VVINDLDKDEDIMSTAQKISFGFAVLSYLAAASCFLMTLYLYFDPDARKSVLASFAASTVFFISVGVVLHVIGKANLPSLRLD